MRCLRAVRSGQVLEQGDHRDIVVDVARICRTYAKGAERTCEIELEVRGAKDGGKTAGIPRTASNNILRASLQSTRSTPESHPSVLVDLFQGKHLPVLP